MNRKTPSKEIPSKGLGKILEEGHDETLKETDRLHAVLTRLRYEGKPSLGKNLKEAREVQSFFEDEVVHHVRFEEEAVFPFLKTHVPRLEPMIWLLQAEHQDFRFNLETFKSRLEELEKTRKDKSRAQVLEALQETGTYLVYLLRNHLRAENEFLYQVIHRELKREEKNQLAHKIAQYRDGQDS